MRKAEKNGIFEVIYNRKLELKIDRNNIINSNVRQIVENLRIFAINKNLKYKG